MSDCDRMTDRFFVLYGNQIDRNGCCGSFSMYFVASVLGTIFVDYESQSIYLEIFYSMLELHCSGNDEFF